MKYIFQKKSGGQRRDKAGERKYKKGRQERKRERKYMYVCGGREVLVCLRVFTSSADKRGVT